ncbi:peptidoglycan recognition protein-like isoform X2 [Zootermopsis nevadensis]|uniref:peptidoglycan recognition protein-like isoform X2 n=1 Tax=Zootermopsis nevadensis TaxID=136037 RepID=UPI000B8E8325|nr:peptidoglycan recognition protein-like isoform X2 [Zootermopsis nevadensis]
MPVDNNINDTTINMTASIPSRKADMQKKDVLATDDGSCTHSNGSSTSEDEEDPDYEGVSTHEVSEVSTGALCLSGSPSNFHMENNSDVQIGPRLHYNAPVTINQFVHVLGSNEVSPDGILQEAVRAPIHGLDAEESNISQDPEPNPNTTLPGDHVIYSKEDWYGVAPKFERQLKHPTPFVVISHTATPACYSPVVCAARMRNFQDVHMGDSHNFPDIGYSFVVGGDGNVYVGRGWDATNMHSGFVKRCNIGISFIGNFVHDTPTNGQIQAVQELIKLGVSLGKIDKNYKLVAMNETFTTLSPGVVLYGIIAKWPHFWKPSHDDIGMCPYTV